MNEKCNFSLHLTYTDIILYLIDDKIRKNLWMLNILAKEVIYMTSSEECLLFLLTVLLLFMMYYIPILRINLLLL